MTETAVQHMRFGLKSISTIFFRRELPNWPVVLMDIFLLIFLSDN